MRPLIAGGCSEENFLNTYHINDGTDNLINLSLKTGSGSSGHQTGAEGGPGGSENIIADKRCGSKGSGPDSPAGDKSSKTAREKSNRQY